MVADIGFPSHQSGRSLSDYIVNRLIYRGSIHVGPGQYICVCGGGGG